MNNQPNERVAALTRFCFEPDAVEANRVLAWVNSICAAFLFIGLLGLKSRPIVIQTRSVPATEAVATIIEPVILPVQTLAADAPGDGTSEASVGGPMVAVTLDTPAVVFAVPTVGNVLVPASLAQAPPANPMHGVAPLSPAKVESVGATGGGGSRPAPGYPLESMRAREQGTVVLLIEVDGTGKVMTVSICESSGYRRLDAAAVAAVKQTWYFGPALGKRMFESPIVFRLQ